MQKLKIVYHNKDLKKLVKEDRGDWIDLRSAETVTLKKGEFKYISLGVSIQLYDGYEANIVPRSSTFKNFKIIQPNHMGVIDETYCGNDDIWHMPVYAMEDTTINFNDRICQFRVNLKQPHIIFDEVESLDNESRGGLGSTGRN